MTITIEEFYEDFRNQLEAKYAGRSDFRRNIFLETIIEEMQDEGEATDYELCNLEVGSELRADAYNLNLDEGTVDLFYADHRGRLGLKPLTKGSMNYAFRRMRNVVRYSRKGALHKQLDETTAGYRLARGISDHRSEIKNARFFLASERRLPRARKGKPSHDIDGVHATYKIWDISRLHGRAVSGREELTIDLAELLGGGLRCLPVNLGTNAYSAYLASVSGDTLAQLYREYGQRLLEQNVRCFLQSRGIVNRGIQETIAKEGHRFFAYNNGITATAKGVTTQSESTGTRIISVKDFQIVNGGQTTVSLYKASIRNSPPDLSQIFVQMKLTVVGDEDSEHVTEKIAEYANTQNKVNAADLQSNNSFLKRMEELSRKIWAPVTGDTRHKTKWYFERFRGQYQSDLMKKDAQGVKEFKAQYPAAQKITKTTLGKVENVWDDEPRWVNLGAQKNFVQYIIRVNNVWNDCSDEFGAEYFKRAVARLIVFKATERLISRQEWYAGGYRANIVAYTLALAGYIAKGRGLTLSYHPIWDQQSIPGSLEQGFAVLAGKAFSLLMSEDRDTQNISEWAKSSTYWDRLKVATDPMPSGIPEAFWDNFEPIDSSK